MVEEVVCRKRDADARFSRVGEWEQDALELLSTAGERPAFDVAGLLNRSRQRPMHSLRITRGLRLFPVQGVPQAKLSTKHSPRGPKITITHDFGTERGGSIKVGSGFLSCLLFIPLMEQGWRARYPTGEPSRLGLPRVCDNKSPLATAAAQAPQDSFDGDGDDVERGAAAATRDHTTVMDDRRVPELRQCIKMLLSEASDSETRSKLNQPLGNGRRWVLLSKELHSREIVLTGQGPFGEHRKWQGG